MVEWRSGSGMFDDPCSECGVVRSSHNDQMAGHEWQASDHLVLIEEEDNALGMTEAEVNARVRTAGRERRGLYDARLPPPAERRRIREEAGWTQQQVADVLKVSRHTISSFY